MCHICHISLEAQYPMLKTALEWLNRGIAVIPIQYKDKRPALSSWREYQDRLPTQDELYQWFFHKFRNLAVVTGWQNLVVIDFDSLASYAEWYKWTEENNKLVGSVSYRVLTARGVHVYVKLAGAKNCKFEGGDIKASGGYVLAPPSIHPSGSTYKALDPRAPIVEVESLEAVLPWKVERDTEQPSTLIFKPLDAWEAASRPMGEMGMIETVKQSVSILDLLPGATPSDTTGRWYKVCCPFHDDQKPSMWIDTLRGLAGCQSCHFKPMDVIDLYAALHRLGLKEAALELAR
jgi:hypothetical protein